MNLSHANKLWGQKNMHTLEYFVESDVFHRKLMILELISCPCGQIKRGHSTNRQKSILFVTELHIILFCSEFLAMSCKIILTLCAYRGRKEEYETFEHVRIRES